MANLTQQMYELIEKILDITRKQRVSYRLRPQREAVLKYLALYPDGVNPSQIADALGLARPAVTSMITVMEEEGLLTRTMNKTDKRRMDVVITAEGMEQKEELVAESQKNAAALVKYLGESDAADFLRIMAKVEKFMETK